MITKFKIYEKTDWNKVLHSATWSNDSEIYDENYIDTDKVKLAIENGADPDSCETLHWAVRMNDFPTVKYMVGNGADVNLRKDSGKWSPFMSAVSPGVYDLKVHNVDFNHKPINLEMCIFLLDNGADPTLANFQNNTALDILSHTKLPNFLPSYQRQSKENQRKMDEISKHIIHLLLEKSPEKAPQYVDYLTDEQKIKLAPYLDAEKFNI